MKKKIIATLCAALMLSGVITGCSGSASSGSQAAASTGTSANTASGAEGKTTLNVLWWGSQTRHEMTTEMLEKFEELNPDIDVVMDYSDWDGYWTKLPAQVAGGQTPDVFQMDYAKLAEYVENGVTADLSSYIADGSLDMSNVEQNILDSGTIDGKVYAISTGTNAPALLYRQDILDELGLSLPMNPTMSEYAEVSKAVYEATGLRISTGTNAPALLYRQDILDELGLSLPMNPTMSEYAEVSKAVYEATGLRDTFITDSSAVIFRQHLRNYGLNLYNEDATALGFDDPKYLVNMWNLALQAQEEGWGLLPGEATATTAFDSMVTDAWSRLQNSNELQAYREATGKDIRMVMIPSLDDATTPASFLKPAMFWCVSADSDVKDAAVRFINFFTNSPECYDIVGIERAVPISSKMREYVAPSLDEISQEVVEYVDYVSQPEMSSPLMNPDPPEHTKVSELLDQYSEQVRYGEITDLETAAQQFMDEANAILAAE